MKPVRIYTSSSLIKLILCTLLLPAAVHAQQKTTVDTVIVVTPEGAAKAPEDRSVKQIVYKVNPFVTVPLSALMTVGNFVAIPSILHAKQDISDAELAALRPELLSPLDRWALDFSPSGRAQWLRVSDIALPATVLGSLSLFLDKKVRQDGWKVALMFYETQAVCFTTYNFSPLGPSFQNRFRPVTYYQTISTAERNRGGNRNSMFSGHVANATAATYFAVKVYTDYHPEIGRKKYLLYGLATIPPLFVGFARIKALAHFPSDVAIGLVLGAVTGITIPSLHKIRNKTVQLGVTYNEWGSGLGLTWKPARKTFKPRNSFTGGPSLASAL